nr:hypothetical protein [Tanacetum cinerariifolium]
MAKPSAESEVFNNSLCSKACKKNSDSLNSKITELTDKLYDAKNMIYHYKLGLAQVKARLAEHGSQELKYCEKIRVLEFNTESRENFIESLTKDLELLKKEKRLDKNKEGLGYSDVPPPPFPAQVYSPPKKDMSWTGLPEFKDDTVTDYSRPSPSIESTSYDAQNRNPSVTKTEASPSTVSPKPFIKLSQVEARLAEHRNQEVKYCEKIRILKFKVESRSNCIESLIKDLELVKKEKGKLETKLTGFHTASKDLDSLLESQRLDKNKEGLGYSAIPPPLAEVYSLPKKDMSWTGLPEFEDDTITDYSSPSLAIESTSDDVQNRNTFVTKTETSPSTISPKPFIKFVKAFDSLTKSKTDKVKTAKKPDVKYVEQYRKSTKKPNVRGNQRN